MNLQEYISSGIIESYVLGLASDEERHEFEQLCGQHPELVQARDAFERQLEQQALSNAIPPPPAIKAKVWAETGLKSETKQSPVVRMGWMKYAVAASLVLLAGSLFWNLNLQKQNQDIQKNLASAREELNNARQSIAAMEADASVLQKPGMKMAALNGMDASPASYATVYWDTTSKDVYLMVNNLPQPPTDKQYQLWAIINGQPVDIGVLTMSQKPLQLYRMRNTQHAQAFAITLETMGGSPVPKGEMYVMGKL